MIFPKLVDSSGPRWIFQRNERPRFLPPRLAQCFPDSRRNAGRETRTRERKQKEKEKTKRKEKKEMKRVVHRVHVDDTECNSGRGQKKKEEGSSRSYRPTFLPFGRVPGALSRLLFSPFPVPVIIVLTFVWLFPSCHAITCRELACRTLRIPRTCPRPTQRRASVLIWP